ncbi:MAG TPA: Spy/CpxP family protein refolding chaperone [Thermoanaerobaculia bacterium]|jgi:Spy/CpxP family protein refolding chaperone
MKRISVIALITILAVAAIAAPPPGRGPAPAGPGGPAPQHGGPGELLPPRALAELLDLTEAQKSSLETLRSTLQSAVEPLRDQQRTNHEQIESALAAGDAAKAGQLLLANYGLAQQIHAAHETFRAGFEALLTSDQKAKLAVYQEILELRRGAGPREP